MCACVRVCVCVRVFTLNDQKSPHCKKIKFKATSADF